MLHDSACHRPRGLIVRMARPADVDAIHEIETEAHIRSWSRRGVASELFPSAVSTFWVAGYAADPCSIAGYICFRIMAGELYVLNLAVSRALRNKGIGTWLLGLCLRLGMKKGITRAVLDVHRDNSAAVRFYRRNGFGFACQDPGSGKIFSVMEMKFF